MVVSTNEKQTMTIMTVISILSLALAVFVLVRIIRVSKHHLFIPAKSRELPIEKMPSVSVCVPVRNEAHAMNKCLDAIIASDYPKLEIIVLDDNSVDNTSSLVKAYANEGVRFVKGDVPPEGWIGRNYAYDKLLAQASGKYVFFMSVDTHLAPDAITKLVAYMSNKDVEMISFMPARLDNYRLSVLLAPLRYFIELVGHTKRTPATASGGWLANRELLAQCFHDMSELKSDIVIERSIAKLFMAANNYDFIVNSRACGVSYEKKWRSQVESSIRFYALTIAGKPLKTLIWLMLFIITSFPMVALFEGFSASLWIFWAAEWTFMSAYIYYTSLIWSRGSWWAWACWPFVVLQELIIVIISNPHIGRKRLTWKGRPIIR
jgi:glycosyltransferase involved in cell wall biosynthesis